MLTKLDEKHSLSSLYNFDLLLINAPDSIYFKIK